MTYLIPFLAFWFGYLLGRMDQIINLLKNKHSNKEDNVLEDDFDKPRSFLQQAKEEVNKTNISIDDRKFVTKMENSFEKNFQKLGKETLSKDNIDSSVSKLAQLKRK